MKHWRLVECDGGEANDITSDELVSLSIYARHGMGPPDPALPGGRAWTKIQPSANIAIDDGAFDPTDAGGGEK